MAELTSLTRRHGYEASALASKSDSGEQRHEYEASALAYRIFRRGYKASGAGLTDFHAGTTEHLTRGYEASTLALAIVP